MNKILIVGLGSIAKKHRVTIKKLYPMATIYMVSSSGRLTLLEIEQVTLCRDLFEAINYAPDFAIVASPATFHFIHTRMLINAGIPVLVEKPVTADPQEAKALVEISRHTQVPIKVAYCLRYLPSALIIKKVLEDNKIGPVYNVSAHVGQYLPTWRKDKHYRHSVSASRHLGGGVLLELSHELDYLQWFLGGLNFKFALLRHTEELALEVEEIADLVLTTEKGTLCSIHMDFIQKSPQRYCYFLGKNGHLYWNLMENFVSFHSNSEKEVLYHEPLWDKNNMYSLMIQDFVAQIRKEKTNNESLIGAYETVKLIEEIKQQATWGVIQ